MSWKDELDQKYNNDFGKSASDLGFGFDDDQSLQSMQNYVADQNAYKYNGRNYQNHPSSKVTQKVSPTLVFYLIFFIITVISGCIFIIFFYNSQRIHPENISKANKRAAAESAPLKDAREPESKMIVLPKKNAAPAPVISSEHNENAENHGENGKLPIPGQSGNAGKYLQYNCTQSFISSDKGYGSPTAPGACPTGFARMEMIDHKANIYDAIEDCRNRGMRLPTNHELSAAGKYATELGLQTGNYWSNNKFKDDYAHNCFMPRGNCGRFYSPPAKSVVQWYRCVVPEDSYQPNEISDNVILSFDNNNIIHNDGGVKNNLTIGDNKDNKKEKVNNKNSNNDAEQQTDISYKMKESSMFSTSSANRTAIETVFRQKKNDIIQCYKTAMDAHGEKLTGHLTIAITVGKNGSVLKVESIKNYIGNEMFACIKQKIMTWQFGALDAPTVFKKTWAFN